MPKENLQSIQPSLIINKCLSHTTSIYEQQLQTLSLENIELFESLSQKIYSLHIHSEIFAERSCILKNKTMIEQLKIKIEERHQVFGQKLIEEQMIIQEQRQLKNMIGIYEDRISELALLLQDKEEQISYEQNDEERLIKMKPRRNHFKILDKNNENYSLMGELLIENRSIEQQILEMEKQIDQCMEEEIDELGQQFIKEKDMEYVDRNMIRIIMQEIIKQENVYHRLSQQQKLLRQALDFNHNHHSSLIQKYQSIQSKSNSPSQKPNQSETTSEEQSKDVKTQNNQTNQIFSLHTLGNSCKIKSEESIETEESQIKSTEDQE